MHRRGGDRNDRGIHELGGSWPRARHYRQRAEDEAPATHVAIPVLLRGAPYRCATCRRSGLRRELAAGRTAGVLIRQTDRALSELLDECDRLRRLRDARWYDALHYVRAVPEEADLLRQLRGSIARAHRLLVRLHVGSHSSAEA